MKDLKKFSKLTNISIKTCEKISKNLGDDWYKKLKLNPYILMEHNGFAFFRTDIIAKKLDFNMMSPLRITAFVENHINNTVDGSTILNMKIIEKEIKERLQIDDKKLIVDSISSFPDKYVFLDENLKKINGYENICYISTVKFLEIEKGYYNMLLDISKRQKNKVSKLLIDSVVSKNTFKPTKEQLNILNTFMDKNITVLTGLAGSGKSSITKMMLDILDAHKKSYLLLSPTGIAAKVIKDSTKRDARTIHSWSHSVDYINANKEYDYIIIDECSMLGCDHWEMIMKGMKNNTKFKIIMIGDEGQLPSICPGDFFRSTIKYFKRGFLDGNYYHLTKVLRQAEDSYIPHFAKFFYNTGLFFAEKNMTHGEKAGIEFEEITNIHQQVYNIVKKNKLNFENTMIINPMRVREHGCDSFNAFIGERTGERVVFSNKNKTYRMNDIIMNTVNSREMDIKNGERLKLVEHIIDKENGDKYICEKIDDNNERIEYDEDTLEKNTILSYANSVHKTQGLGVDNVILIISNKHYYMLNKQLVYTAITRTRKKLWVLYDSGMMRIAANKDGIDSRLTFLTIHSNKSN